MAPLAGLPDLTELWIADNQISDITPLSNLTNLQALELNGNQISDVSALSGLDKLGQLYLSRNMISDIAPLVENKGLSEGDKVDLAGNPLNDAAHDVHIPALQERGVEVNLTPEP